MALTYADVTLWTQLKTAKLVKPGGRLLEIGQSNWYGDVSREWLQKEMQDAGGDWSDIDMNCAFGQAKAFYRLMFAPSYTLAIDYHGKEDAYKLDLNSACAYVCRLANDYDIVINGGTTEHVFNQYNAFKLIHNACKVGGIIYHGVPWRGWLDHGFYCYQPTFFYDLARANSYRFLAFCGFELGKKDVIPFKNMAHIHELEKAGKLAHEMMLYVVMRKEIGGEFKVPFQGVYDDAKPIDGTLKADWHTMRSG